MKIVISLLIVILVAVLTSCGGSDNYTKEEVLALLENGETKESEHIIQLSGVIRGGEIENANFKVYSHNLYEVNLEDMRIYWNIDRTAKELDFVKPFDLDEEAPFSLGDIDIPLSDGDKAYACAALMYNTVNEDWEISQLELGTMARKSPLDRHWPTAPSYGEVVVDGDYVYLVNDYDTLTFRPDVTEHVFKGDEIYRSELQNRLIPFRGERVILWYFRYNPRLDDIDFDVERIK